MSYLLQSYSGGLSLKANFLVRLTTQTGDIVTRLTQHKVSSSEAVNKALAIKARSRLRSRQQDQCPLDFARGLLHVYHSESCGKCTPCKTGLAQAISIIDKLLYDDATETDFARLEQLGRYIYECSDCAIGYESGKALNHLVSEAREDFLSHIHHGKCAQERSNFVPCQQSCPAHINIPGYITLVEAGRFDNALRLIRNDNPLPATCGYVCEHPCELSCRRALIDDPINICALKRYADDHAQGYNPPTPHADTGKQIAIIGAGPAGLTAAYYLRLMGHKVVLIDAHEKLGGMVRYGIPDYRLPQNVLDRDINFILSTGITVLNNTEVGKDISFEELHANYDALYIALGAQGDKKLGLEHENASGIISAVEFLRLANSGTSLDLSGMRVLVIGGGNVAMDCTRTARRLNPLSVECVYRRRIQDMTALDEEIHEAFAEGCQITELLAPAEIKVNNENHVVALGFDPQMISSVQRGRPAPKSLGGEFVWRDCDLVIIAIGQSINTAAFGDEISRKWDRILVDESGRIIPGDKARLTDALPVFAGGDAQSGPSTVIEAIAAGKLAAANIDEALGFKHDIFDIVDIPHPKPNLEATGRVELQDEIFAESAKSFKLAKRGMRHEESRQECARCLRCDHFGFGAITEGEVGAW